MKLLTDRHHADLLYSTQRLFEDRLGVEVYVPIGREWWDEGLWQFGKSLGDDRLVQQYLVPHEGIWTRDESGWPTTFDTAHPDRAIRGVTLADARLIDWAFVMPTVQENQAGFHRLAKEVGATYLYQLGNVGQQVSWDLNPRILTSTNASIEGRDAVRYHQEIDSGPGQTFGFALPPDRATVRSFVNAFNRLGSGYAEFLQAEAALPDYRFTVHGHEGRDGNINPVDAMAVLMRDSGWAWHHKPVGDGFGHVIHSWAAVGRPLIGHASFYRGTMAEPFWHHGFTCIDLDQVSVAEAVRMVEATDARQHEIMCRDTRSTFDRLVDYEAEARMVAAFLGLV